MNFADSTYYEGEWKAGKPQGCGKEGYPDGSMYTGQFQGDKRHGLGVYVFADKTVYAGNWSKGLQHGVGLKMTATEKTVCTFETCVLLFDLALLCFFHAHHCVVDTLTIGLRPYPQRNGENIRGV